MNDHHQTTPRRTSSRSPGEQGWVLIAAMIVSGIAATLTMSWARHAVLSKGHLEMAHGASETEEHVYSGIERTREKMRDGKGPGTLEDGEDDVVILDDGDRIRCERDEKSHDRRQIKSRCYRPSGDWSQESSTKARCRVEPRGGSKKSSGERTCLTQESGDSVMLAGNLTIGLLPPTGPHHTEWTRCPTLPSTPLAAANAAPPSSS